MTNPLRTTRRKVAFGATLVALVAAVLVALAVPSRPAAATQLAGDLSRDLDLASAAGVSLAPSGTGTQVVSAVELGAAPERAPAAAPKAAASPRKAPVRKARPQPRAEPAPVEEVEEAPVEAPAPAEVAPAPAPAVDAPLPRPMPNQRREPPPGGWKTPSEIIRNAPFPINP